MYVCVCVCVCLFSCFLCENACRPCCEFVFSFPSVCCALLSAATRGACQWVRPGLPSSLIILSNGFRVGSVHSRHEHTHTHTHTHTVYVRIRAGPHRRSPQPREGARRHPGRATRTGSAVSAAGQAGSGWLSCRAWSPGARERVSVCLVCLCVFVCLSVCLS
jgi:hypothetical protein